MARLLPAALLLYSTFSATASFDSPKVLNPYTNTSPSGKLICEVDPTDIYGRGDAKYRFVQNGLVVWEGVKEQWYPLPATERVLVVGYRDAFMVDAQGTVQRKIQRRPDGNWLEHPGSASVAPDGTVAIVSGG